MTRIRTENTQQVQLPARIVERVEERIRRTEFDDAGEYVAYVVEEVLATVEDDSEAGTEMDDTDREELETRLKSLGYLED